MTSTFYIIKHIPSGLPIEEARTTDLFTSANFFDTAEGNFADLAAAAQKAGPKEAKKMKQEDILAPSVLALSGSVAERMEFGKVIDRQAVSGHECVCIRARVYVWACRP